MSLTPLTGRTKGKKRSSSAPAVAIDHDALMLKRQGEISEWQARVQEFLRKGDLDHAEGVDIDALFLDTKPSALAATLKDARKARSATQSSFRLAS